MTKALLTPEFRLFRNNLFVVNEKKKLPNGKRVGNDKYGIEMGFSKAEHPRGPAELVAAIKEVLAGQDVDFVKAKLVERIKDGDKQLAEIVRKAGDKAAEQRKKYGHLAGHWIVRANTGFPLLDSGAIGTASGEVITDANKGKIVAGTYGRAAVVFKLVSGPDGDGLACYLQGYMFTRPGEKLAVGEPGGKPSFASLFGGVTGGASDQAPADVADDDIPF